MRIAIGNDHRGVKAKQDLTDLLQRLGHTCVDLGSNSEEPVDYPDIAAAVAKDVASGGAERGILVCGTGVGMAIAANKIHHIRAATCDDVKTAELMRRHNNTNVLCLASDFVCKSENHDPAGACGGTDSLEEVVQTWLTTPFDGGRHERRVEKIAKLENESVDSLN